MVTFWLQLDRTLTNKHALVVTTNDQYGTRPHHVGLINVSVLTP